MPTSLNVGQKLHFCEIVGHVDDADRFSYRVQTQYIVCPLLLLRKCCRFMRKFVYS